MTENNPVQKTFEDIFQEFKSNIQEIKHLEAVHSYLSENNVKLYIDNILRAELVFAVSAFDHYIHELAKHGLVSVFQGQINANQHSDEFQFSLKTVQLWLDPNIDQNVKIQELLFEIQTKHSYKTFQTAGNVANALQPVLGLGLWDRITKILFSKTNQTEGEYKEYIKNQAKIVTERLNKIVARRNQIAHSFDRISDNFGGTAIQEIFKEDVTESIDFLENLGRVINNLLTS